MSQEVNNSNNNFIGYCQDEAGTFPQMTEAWKASQPNFQGYFIQGTDPTVASPGSVITMNTVNIEDWLRIFKETGMAIQSNRPEYAIYTGSEGMKYWNQILDNYMVTFTTESQKAKILTREELIKKMFE